MKKNNLYLNDIFLGIIKYSSLTEKAINLHKYKRYTFIVTKTLTKTEIKFILEKIFSVKIIKINTSIIPIKLRKVNGFIGKKACYKKVFIKLKQNENITEFLD
jgi:large subunit ribosomal protein L23